MKTLPKHYDFHAVAGNVYGSGHPFIVVGHYYIGDFSTVKSDTYALPVGFATAELAKADADKLNGSRRLAKAAFSIGVKVWRWPQTC